MVNYSIICGLINALTMWGMLAIEINTPTVVTMATFYVIPTHAAHFLQ